mmetsp:Transcript_48661/g.114908  ORF Transcript_48661/g.114908 Transcript_48661/m.114908 type:complete len:213 (+) Transcript_48661:470-1108(+)
MSVGGTARPSTRSRSARASSTPPRPAPRSRRPLAARSDRSSLRARCAVPAAAATSRRSGPSLSASRRFPSQTRRPSSSSQRSRSFSASRASSSRLATRPSPSASAPSRCSARRAGPLSPTASTRRRGSRSRIRNACERRPASARSGGSSSATEALVASLRGFWVQTARLRSGTASQLALKSQSQAHFAGHPGPSPASRFCKLGPDTRSLRRL